MSCNCCPNEEIIPACLGTDIFANHQFPFDRTHQWNVPINTGGLLDGAYIVYVGTACPTFTNTNYILSPNLYNFNCGCINCPTACVCVPYTSQVSPIIGTTNNLADMLGICYMGNSSPGGCPGCNRYGAGYQPYQAGTTSSFAIYQITITSNDPGTFTNCLSNYPIAGTPGSCYKVVLTITGTVRSNNATTPSIKESSIAGTVTYEAIVTNFTYVQSTLTLYKTSNSITKCCPYILGMPFATDNCTMYASMTALYTDFSTMPDSITITRV